MDPQQDIIVPQETPDDIDQVARHAQRQIDQYQAVAAILTFALIIGTAWMLFVCIAPVASIHAPFLLGVVTFIGFCLAVLCARAACSFVRRHSYSHDQYEKVEIWRRELVAMHPHSNVQGSVTSSVLWITSQINTALEYHYLYDDGDGIASGVIPSKNLKIYTVLADGEAPYIVHWRERAYRESLLVDPPARLPEADYWPDTDSDTGYSVYLPIGSAIGAIELV